MKLENMFKKTKSLYREQSVKHTGTLKPEVPQGLLRKCNKCGAAIVTEDVKKRKLYLSEMRRIFQDPCIYKNPYDYRRGKLRGMGQRSCWRKSNGIPGL